MAFLSWLMSQGHGLDQIAQTMVSLGDTGTLAQLYANLTSDAASNAWPAFLAAVAASVRTGLVSAPTAKAASPTARCASKSRRLLPPGGPITPIVG
jgi:hypothetical protein